MTHTITYLDDDVVTEVRITTAPHFHSATGYGAKIPTHHMLRIQGRWHRVYMICYSNSGTAYVLKGGQRLVLDSSTEHRMEMYGRALHLGLGGLKFPDRTAQPVRIDKLTRGDRFCFHFDGVASTLVSTAQTTARYTWSDYQGVHTLHGGTYALDGKPAWPYVHPTLEPETEVKVA